MKNLKQLCDANNRRDFIQKATTIALGAAILPNMSAAKIEGRDESRAFKVPTLFYHHDGSFLMYGPAPISLENFVHETVERFVGTQVGGIIAHMFSAGDACPLFQTAISETKPIIPKKVKSVNNWRSLRNLSALLEMPQDPWKAAIAAAHAQGKEFWTAMRFNDGHPETYGLRSRFSLDHPEYFIPGDVHRDYSRPEVRSLRLRQIAEVCSNYNVDGFELDFTRDIGVHFPENKSAIGINILTKYLLEIRQTLDALGEKRGRPIKFGVRVPGTLEICELVGYNVRAWLSEVRLDMLTPSVYYDTSCELPFGSFVELARGTSCLIYASVTEGVGPGRFAPPPLQAIRAAALNAWKQGVSGINLFNFHHHIMTNRVEDLVLLSELGCRQTLEFVDKLYMIAGNCFHYQGQNKSITEYEPDKPPLGDHPRQVPVLIEIGGQGRSIRIPVGDNIEKAKSKHLLSSIILRLDLCNITGDEEIEFSLNNKIIPLSMAKLGISQQYPWNWNGMHSQLEIEFDLSQGDWVVGGDNQLRLKLGQRPSDIELPLMLWAVRLEIKYNVFPMRLGYQIGV